MYSILGGYVKKESENLQKRCSGILIIQLCKQSTLFKSGNNLFLFSGNTHHDS